VYRGWVPSRTRTPLWIPLIVALLAPAEVLAEARFEGLGLLHGKYAFTSAYGVSGDGSVVVGSSYRHSFRAVRWTEKGGKFRMAALGGRRSHAYAASADGAVIVGEVRRRVRLLFPSPFPEVTFDAGRWSRVRGYRIPREREGSFATDVSADGSIVCGAVDDAGNKAVIWIGAGGPMPLGDLPGSDGSSIASGISGDGNVVVGSAGAYYTQAFRWTAPSGMVALGTLPGHDASRATAVSADGSTVVGASGVLRGDWEAFRWTEAEGMVGLGDLPGGQLNSEANDVSGDGSRVIGRGSPPYNQVAPFLWDAAGGMRPLTEALSEEYGLDVTDWDLETATGVSHDGTVVVGTGTVFENGTYYRAAWRAVIPAP
jgi:probable HAF family extracellular repeat protein